MAYQGGHKQQKGLFQKGMTLQQYFRSMEVTEDTAPTADSQFGYEQEKQQNLYKTSHCFYNPNFNANPNSIKEIQQENFEESLDHRRDCVNIVSSNFQPAAKKAMLDHVFNEESKKNYRIRNGKSMSPYNQHVTKIQNKKTLSPYKTFMKKFYTGEKEHKISDQISKRETNKNEILRALQGRQFQVRKSTKNIKIDAGHYIIKNSMEHHERESEEKLNYQLKFSDRFQPELEKIDFRVENIKDRLQLKRKNKIKY